MSQQIQYCSGCNGAVQREHFAITRTETHERRFLYCEFCGVGWEVAVYADGDIIPITFCFKRDAKAMANFLKRLFEAVRAATADKPDAAPAVEPAPPRRRHRRAAAAVA